MRTSATTGRLPSTRITAGHTTELTDTPVEELLAEAFEADPATREEILSGVIVSQLPLARSIAARYRDRGEQLEDLVQVASMALVMAVQRYRVGQGVSFAAYAVPTITGELRRYFRDHGWAIRPPRRIQELRPRVRTAAQELAQELHRAPTADEVAELLDVSAEDVRETQMATAEYHSLSLDLPGRDDDDATSLADRIGGPDPRIDSLVDLISVRPLLTCLSSRDRRILALRFFDGRTQQQIADEIGVTQMQVSRLLAQAISKLQAMACRD